MMVQLLSLLPSYCEGLGAGGEGPWIGDDIGVFLVPVKPSLGFSMSTDICA